MIYERFFLGKWKRYLALILFLTVSVLLMIPQFYATNPNLIDDSVDLAAIRTRGVLVIYDDFVGERTYPLRTSLRFVLYQLFGLKTQYHFFSLAVLLGLTAWLSYRLQRRLGIGTILAVVTTMVIFILPPTWANYYRLGTAEHLQVFFLLALAILLLAKKDILAFLFYLLALLTKETSILYALIPLVIFYKRGRRNLLFLTLATTSFLALFILLKFTSSNYQPYISEVQLRLPEMIRLFKNSLVFQPYYYVVLCLNLVFLVHYLAKRRSLKPGYLILVLFNLAALPPNFIWRTEWHYLFPAYLWLIILSSYTLSLTATRVKKKDRLAFWGLILALAFPLFQYLANISLKVGKSWHKDYLLNGSLTSFLLRQDLRETKIYSGIAKAEENGGIYFYATHLDEYSIDFEPEVKYSFSIVNGTDSEEFKRISLETSQRFLAAKRKGLLILKQNVGLPGAEVLPLCADSPFMKKECRYFIYTN